MFERYRGKLIYFLQNIRLKISIFDLDRHTKTTEIATTTIPLKDIKAVKLEVRDGINPRRRISLRVQGRKDIPMTGVGKLLTLVELEKQGAELARFLGVNLEGL